LLWSSEGARVVTGEKNLAKPFVEFYGFKGKFSKHFHPRKFKMQEVEKGPRNNGTLEGMHLIRNSNDILDTEEPLFEDGDQATTSKGGLIRLYQFDVKTKRT
jgi:hypothetical protein